MKKYQHVIYGFIFFKNSGTSTEEISNMPLFSLLKAVFDTNNWDKDEKKQYQEHRKYHKERCAEMTQRYIESGVELDKKYLNKPALEVEWNWLLLEKQLGQLPRNKVKASDIDLSALKADLPQLAFDLFRKWTKKCLEKHPSLDLTIIDEQILVKDVQQQMQESLIALFDNDTFYRDNMSKNYATGFVIGYVQGSLSSHWYMEYVIKTNDIFKTTMALQSLSTYLQTEDVMRLQVDRIYEEVMRGKVNLSNPKLDIQKIDLTSKKGKVVEKNNSKGVVQTALINLVNEYINKISAIEIEDFDLTVSDFIDSQKIERFIETNWHLF